MTVCPYSSNIWWIALLDVPIHKYLLFSDCGPSPFIKYGNTSLGTDNKTTFGATVFVSCQDKYVATSSSIKCQASGLWENATCVFKGN